MGIEPRVKSDRGSMTEFISVRLIIITIFLGFVGLVAEFMAEMDINFAVWEPEFLEQFGDGFIWLPISAAAIILIVVVGVAIKLSNKNKKGAEQWSA